MSFPLQATKKVALEPKSFTNGATASVTIDRLGYNAVTIDVLLGHATSVPSTLKLQESDDNTTFADIATATFTATYTTANTSTVDVLTYDVDCKARKRYLKLVVIPATTQVIAANANLYRAENAPVDATGKGIAGFQVL